MITVDVINRRHRVAWRGEKLGVSGESSDENFLRGLIRAAGDADSSNDAAMNQPKSLDAPGVTGVGGSESHDRRSGV